MDIKEIAERVSKRIYVEDGLLLSKFISEKFAEVLIAEIAKQNKPVNACPVGVALNAVSHVGAANYDHREREARRWIYEAEKQLYTFPPTAEQIANETAEACAKYIDSTNGNIRGVNTVFSKALRSGAWKEFKK